MQTRKNVLYVDTSMGFGGAVVSLSQIVHHLQNYHPVLVFYSHETPLFHKLFKTCWPIYLRTRFTYKHKWVFFSLLDKHVRFRPLNFLLKKSYIAASILYEAYLLRVLRRLIRKRDIALLHANNCPYPLLIRAAKAENIPCVVHLRGHIDCAGSQREIQAQLDCLIAPTRNIACYAREALGVPENKIVTIYNSVDTRAYANPVAGDRIREKFGLSKDVTVLGMFARIIRMKGQMVLVKAACRLLDQGLNVACLLVGDKSDGGEAYDAELHAYIERTGKARHFIFTGYQDAVEAYYHACDIVIHPSIEDEAFGRVIIEAWAARKPLVASDIPASKELVGHAETGWLVPKADEEKLAEAIRHLIMHPEIRKMLADEGHKKVMQDFDAASTTRKIESIYHELLTGVPLAA